MATARRCHDGLRPARSRRSWPAARTDSRRCAGADLAHGRRDRRRGTRDLDRGQACRGPSASSPRDATTARATGSRPRPRWTPPSRRFRRAAGWCRLARPAPAGDSRSARAREPACGHHPAGGRRRRVALAALDPRLPPTGKLTLASRLALRDGAIVVEELDLGSPLASVKGSGSYVVATRIGQAKANLALPSVAPLSAFAEPTADGQRRDRLHDAERGRRSRARLAGHAQRLRRPGSAAAIWWHPPSASPVRRP